MGAKLNIYNKVRERILEIPEIRHVAKWNNQTENEAVEMPYEYPAVFIGFSSIDWLPDNTAPYNVNLANFQQVGNLTITLYCVFWHITEESLSFEKYEPVITKIWQKLQGFQGDSFTPMMRIAEREDDNHDSVINWQIDYTTTIYECVEPGDLVNAAPLTVQLTGDLIINPVTDATIRTAGEFDEDP
jgi:hypothetical protein